ncbi:hypothetical protein HYDPIDRAFT_134817 [Hydnomerulius pinastri MD-312]|uniref:DUF914-domain-containing protein n=1 Tax=Hydnomerulius pinastri MD-312 TaxID=994086 RepID=A0A0C9VBP3_9AGAM|nr:hypothetical protein HYDPIDRAFT_134817 [Hydnomerulius pinastri MD-312]
MPSESSLEMKEQDELQTSPSPDCAHLPTKRVRPPIVFDSPKAFVNSLHARFLSLWTRSFAYSLIGGQVLSLCITCSSVTTTELVDRNWVLPSTQTFFTYLSLFVVFTPYTIYRYGFKGWGKVILRDGWKYFLLAACDVEANFLSVKAYGYTDLLSCMLLDAWAIPVCLLSCWVYMKTKYHWTQIFGVGVCIAGLGLLVASDFLTGKDGHAESRGKGDAFMVAAATIYGVVNATEEFFVRHSPLYEVVGQVGMWGVLVSGIQASALEHTLMPQMSWNGATIGLLVGYTAAMFTLYSLAPLLYRTASSSYFNIALLTSDFYGLLFGLFLFHYSPYWLYFPAFVVVILGLVIYFWHATPEEQGESNVQIPAYIAAQQQSDRDVES